MTPPTGRPRRVRRSRNRSAELYRTRWPDGRSIAALKSSRLESRRCRIADTRVRFVRYRPTVVRRSSNRPIHRTRYDRYASRRSMVRTAPVRYADCRSILSKSLERRGPDPRKGTGPDQLGCRTSTIGSSATGTSNRESIERREAIRPPFGPDHVRRARAVQLRTLATDYESTSERELREQKSYPARCRSIHNAVHREL